MSTTNAAQPKPISKYSLVRVRRDILELAKTRAAEEHRSLTNYVAWLIIEDTRPVKNNEEG